MGNINFEWYCSRLEVIRDSDAEWAVEWRHLASGQIVCPLSPFTNFTTRHDATQRPSNLTGDMEDRLSHNRHNQIQNYNEGLPLWQCSLFSLGKYRPCS